MVGVGTLTEIVDVRMVGVVGARTEIVGARTAGAVGVRTEIVDVRRVGVTGLIVTIGARTEGDDVRTVEVGFTEATLGVWLGIVNFGAFDTLFPEPVRVLREPLLLRFTDDPCPELPHVRNSAQSMRMPPPFEPVLLDRVFGFVPVMSLPRRSVDEPGIVNVGVFERGKGPRLET